MRKLKGILTPLQGVAGVALIAAGVYVVGGLGPALIAAGVFFLVGTVTQGSR